MKLSLEHTILENKLVEYFSNPDNYSYYDHSKNTPEADWKIAVIDHAMDEGLPADVVALAEQKGLEILKQRNPELFK